MMRNIKKNSHTSTLFHYTRKKSSLLSILKEGFKFGYCQELLPGDKFVAFPVLCFCDIPISESEEHSSKYGKYAVGLSKEFLITQYSKGLGPVNYVLTDLPVRAAFHLREVAKQYDEEFSRIVEEDDGQRVRMNFMGKEWVGRGLSGSEGEKSLSLFFNSNKFKSASSRAIGLMKPYSSSHKGKIFKNYDECEWRMVIPEFADLGDCSKCKWYWNKDEYERWRQEDYKNHKFLDELRLTFSVEDINFIIVPKEKDILKIVNDISSINNLCGVCISDNDKAVLYSKIISFEQIKMNF